MGIKLYKIKYTKKAIKFLEKHNDLKNYIKIVFTEILHSPYQGLQNYDINKLQGMKDIYRLRKGKYRIIFEIKDKELIIIVIDADSRGDAYK